MNKQTVLSIFLLLAFVTVLVGAVAKIMHLGGSEWLLGAGMVSTVVFTVMALWEVLTKAPVRGFEKLMWIVGLLFMPLLAGLLYLLVGRKRLLGHSTSMV
jgi:hypothetical protein